MWLPSISAACPTSARLDNPSFSLGDCMGAFPPVAPSPPQPAPLVPSSPWTAYSTPSALAPCTCADPNSPAWWWSRCAQVLVSKVMQSLKRFTGLEGNRILGVKGQAFWQDESYDRLVRDRGEFERIVEYIEMNPVHAWTCSSVRGVSLVEREAD